MYKLASHNSFTFDKPKGLFSKLFCFCGRCQNIGIVQQYNHYGVRMFDLRVFPNGDTFDVCHGPIKFDSTYLHHRLGWLDNQAEDHKEKVYIRILLEQNTIKKNQDELDEKFKKICSQLESTYNNLTFICGRRKCDWKVVYEFVNKEPSMTELYSSVTNMFKWKWLRKIDDLWPKLYAILNNKKNLEKNYNTEFLMIDFINIR